MIDHPASRSFQLLSDDAHGFFGFYLVFLLNLSKRMAHLWDLKNPDLELLIPSFYFKSFAIMTDLASLFRIASRRSNVPIRLRNPARNWNLLPTVTQTVHQQIPIGSDNERATRKVPSVMLKSGFIGKSRELFQLRNAIEPLMPSCTKIGQGVACINPGEFTRNKKIGPGTTGGGDVFDASVISRMHRVLCDLGKFSEVEAIEATNLESLYLRRIVGQTQSIFAMFDLEFALFLITATLAFIRSYGNLPLIHLEFEKLELDRRELGKQEVEQPEVDRLDLDEPGIGKLELD
ncbi:hypothetical protein Tco_0198778 [Tanacetum coccineum]